ncbi:MAG: hypothetical protein P4L72_02905 [Parvibaculum sp.]|jgi:hypothetical protein|uniref:hypothetical protein n=1 Tax=Parvibaculum sp. TaxID=2024848 RepID=UPI0028523A25|nr:hypothetical protein [Parvibaculum sp.]MDR3498160.1 hypothetical protein [Parvibaculum sp.]
MSSLLRLSLLVPLLLLAAACSTRPSTSAILASTTPPSDVRPGPLTPDSLVGVAPEALTARLGVPSFKRTEPGAQVWQYGGEGCSLFIYFYKNAGGALTSAYVDARRSAGGSADASACLAAVTAKRNTPTS